jgi:hypothetical protein
MAVGDWACLYMIGQRMRKQEVSHMGSYFHFDLFESSSEVELMKGLWKDNSWKDLMKDRCCHYSTAQC